MKISRNESFENAKRPQTQTIKQESSIGDIFNDITLNINRLKQDIWDYITKINKKK